MFFNLLDDYIIRNDDKSFTIGGDFNTVLNIEADKKNGRQDIHEKCREKNNSIFNWYMETFGYIQIKPNLLGIWTQNL